ncbi:hypothetical protein MKZ38_000051 [Zalerion maritima]|uniref:Uncharacterized protein n=1 Tax=Zalerion maritima TaxID=339359 RepID=A0AAD5RSU7_9PEZI|nr:hypothetical protein MKZ38_000051 [Zalerion maritima]
MSRAIDKLPEPKNPKQMKIIVLSAGRNGTQSLFSAFKMLGYTPYHMSEVVREGKSHMNCMIECLEAKYKGNGKVYGRKEFEKWFANYDVLIAIPTFFLEELVQAYPECKFILTTRNEDSWLKSINNTFKKRMLANEGFPIKHISYVDPFTSRLLTMLRLVRFALWRGVDLEAPGADKALLSFYNEHNANAVKITPKPNLLVVRLEDGLGWEEVCPFLGIDIPKEPYPRGNVPNEFHKKVFELFYHNWWRALKGISYAAVPAAAAAGAWYMWGSDMIKV